MENTVNISSNRGPGEEVSLKELILMLRKWCQYLLGKWKTILLAGIFGGLLGFVYAKFQKPIYTAECTFVLEEQGGGGGLGQYAGLASMVGIDIGANNGNGLFKGDNIIELYKSRRMLQQTLLTSVTFNGKSQLLIDRYIGFNNLRETWDKNPQLKGISFHIPLSQFKLKHDSIITSIVNEINKNYLSVQKPDKKLSIIRVQVKSRDELFAKSFTDALVENVNRFYVDTKTKKSVENLQILQRQADSVRRVLNASIGGTASAIDANPNANPALQVLRVPSQRRQIDVQATSAIYTEIVKNLELAKLSLRREAPLIQVVDIPILPLQKLKLGTMTGAGIGFLLLILIVVLRFGVIYLMQPTREGTDAV